jgi:predicted nucleic acid-binding protein
MRSLLDVNVLLALAVRHGGRLATFDAAIPLQAVHGATARHLVQL